MRNGRRAAILPCPSSRLPVTVPPLLAPPSARKATSTRKKGWSRWRRRSISRPDSFPITSARRYSLRRYLFHPRLMQTKLDSLLLEIRAPHSISLQEKEERGKSLHPPTKPAHVRGGEATFALREAEPPFFVNTFSRAPELSR